jgi:cell division septum initiation protein DivIVA
MALAEARFRRRIPPRTGIEGVLMDQSSAQPATTAAVPELPGDDAHPIGDDADLQAYAGFDGALRGYDRRQVNKYVARTTKRIEELTAELASVRRNEQILSARIEELTKAQAMCTCDPNKPESAVVGARLRQIIDIATTEADDLRTRAEAESKAMREEAENLLADARQQAEQATSSFDAMLAHRKATEEAAAAERRAAIEGWAERHVTEARETAQRVIERAGAVSSQVIASARWLVDALGAHRDALSEQLGGVQRRIDELPSLEAAAVPGENLATVPADGQPAAEPAADAGPDEASQPVRGVVRIGGAHSAAEEIVQGEATEGPARPANPALPAGGGRPPAHAAPADAAPLNRTWTPVSPRVGGAHRG